MRLWNPVKTIGEVIGGVKDIKHIVGIEDDEDEGDDDDD